MGFYNLLLFCTFVFTQSESEWESWKKNRDLKHQNSPTSFLNASSLVNTEKGNSLYLIHESDRKKTQWVKTKPKKFLAHAEHIGDQIRIKINELTWAYLTPGENNNRKNFKLPNGAWAEIVYGKRTEKMWAYLYDPDQIKSFSGFKYFPYNQSAVIKGSFKKTPEKVISYKTVQGEPAEVRKIGHVSFLLNNQEHTLSAYSWQEPSEVKKSIALIFVDSTAPQETYAGGRELMVDLTDPKKDQQQLVLDFNKTTNFYCVHSPFWHCPVGLQEKINQPVRAGERLPLSKVQTK